jgi:hypothetical protein
MALLVLKLLALLRALALPDLALPDLALPDLARFGGLAFDSEIGFADQQIFANFSGRAFRNLTAEIEHHHLLAQCADEVHIVLDDEQGDAALAADRSEMSAQRIGFGGIEAGGRLVEQQ